MTTARTLSARESARLLWGLTRPDRVEHLSRVAERYPQGAVLATPLGRMLITSTPEATKHVLVTDHHKYQKGLGQSHARQIIGDGLLTAEGAHWKGQRQDATPALRAKAIETHHADIARLAEHSVHTFASADSTSTNPSVLLAEYTLGCLGQTVGFTPPPAKEIHDAFETVQDEALLRSVSQGMLPLWTRPRHRHRLQRAMTVLATMTAASLAGQHRQERWATREGMTSLFLAGYETTASTLSWALAHLAARPHLQERIRREAEPVLRTAALTNQWNLGDLRFTDAVFKETLRLRPPVWLLSREAISPDTVDGVDLRPGDEVLLLPSVMARRGWEDPDTFRPDRFLDTQHKPGLWFGAGPRACPGGALASAEAVLWLAYASTHLELRLRPGVRVTSLARMSQTPAQDLRQIVQIQPRQEWDELATSAAPLQAI